MLLRWLVNQYVRDAAEGKARDLVGNFLGSQQPDPQAAERQPPARPESHALQASPPQPRTPDAASPATPRDEFLPCEAALVFALGIEAGGLVDRLTGAETSRHAHGIERAGRLERREVVVIEAGVGAKAATRATNEAIQFYRPKWVISAGFAGALDAALRRGHIIMSDEVADLAGERLAVGLKFDPQSLAATKGLHVGRLLTVDSLIRQPAERRRLATEHQALACDMESFAIAAACRQRGVPFLAVRIISDAVEDTLPPEIEHLLAQKSLAGKFGAATGAIFKRFSAAKDLWQLREDALKASDRLAKFLAGVVQQLPAPRE